jgi:hypothetical protein
MNYRLLLYQFAIYLLLYAPNDNTNDAPRGDRVILHNGEVGLR